MAKASKGCSQTKPDILASKWQDAIWIFTRTDEITNSYAEDLCAKTVSLLPRVKIFVLSAIRNKNFARSKNKKLNKKGVKKDKGTASV